MNIIKIVMIMIVILVTLIAEFLILFGDSEMVRKIRDFYKRRLDYIKTVF